MTQVSYPWTGTATGDAGPYSADTWAHLWREMIGIGSGAGGSPNSGVLWGSGANPDPGLTVKQNSPTGQSVILSAGAAQVDGTMYTNRADLVLAVAANGAGNPRVDTVVLRKDWAAQTIRAVVKQGTPAASPVPPGLTQSQGVTWEIPIGDLTLASAYTTIATAQIANRFNFKNVAPMQVIENCQNASGITVNPGDVGVFATVSRQITTSSNKGAPVAGVWMDRVVNGGYGRLLRRGIYPVRIGAAVAAINSVVIHDANFVAAVPAAGSSLYGAFAVTLETTGGAGLCLCYVDCHTPHPKATVRGTYQTPADITSASTTFVDIDGTNLKLTINTNTGRVLTRFRLPIYFGHGVGTGSICFNIKRDGTTLATADANGLHIYNSGDSTGSTANQATTQSIEYVWDGLTTGQHTFTVQWRALLGTATAPVMGVRRYDQLSGHTAFMVAEELDA